MRPFYSYTEINPWRMNEIYSSRENLSRYKSREDWYFIRTGWWDHFTECDQIDPRIRREQAAICSRPVHLLPLKQRKEQLAIRGISYFKLKTKSVYRFKVLTTPLVNPLNAKLNRICHLQALLGAHRILHVSRIRVNRVKKNQRDAQLILSTVIPRLTKIIRSGITFVSRNLR